MGSVNSHLSLGGHSLSALHANAANSNSSHPPSLTATINLAVANAQQAINLAESHAHDTDNQQQQQQQQQQQNLMMNMSPSCMMRQDGNAAPGASCQSEKMMAIPGMEIPGMEMEAGEGNGSGSGSGSGNESGSGSGPNTATDQLPSDHGANHSYSAGTTATDHTVLNSNNSNSNTGTGTDQSCIDGSSSSSSSSSSANDGKCTTTAAAAAADSAADSHCHSSSIQEPELEINIITAGKNNNKNRRKKSRTKSIGHSNASTQPIGTAMPVGGNGNGNGNHNHRNKGVAARASARSNVTSSSVYSSVGRDRLPNETASGHHTNDSVMNSLSSPNVNYTRYNHAMAAGFNNNKLNTAIQHPPVPSAVTHTHTGLAAGLAAAKSKPTRHINNHKIGPTSAVNVPLGDHRVHTTTTAVASVGGGSRNNTAKSGGPSSKESSSNLSNLNLVSAIINEGGVVKRPPKIARGRGVLAASNTDDRNATPATVSAVSPPEHEQTGKVRGIRRMEQQEQQQTYALIT